MSAAAVSKEQIRAIHTLKSRARLDDDTYRDFLARETGKRSSTELSRREAIKVIDGLQALQPVQSGVDPHLKRHALPGPYAAKLRALWISAWHLGIARDRRDSALIAFVKRQTGIDHTRWLREPADASKVIEGLKAWIAREGHVRWDEDPDPKLCVLAAQHRMLGEPWPDRLPPSLDALMAELGAELRARQERQ